MELNDRIINGGRQPLPTVVELAACLNARGLYKPEQFVLRLSREVHRRLALLKDLTDTTVDFETLQAVSTHLHETVHWWQHSGSVAGFVQSLAYPVQSHANHSALKDLVARVGPVKSIHQFIEQAGERQISASDLRVANTVINNYYDIEFFRVLTTRPRAAKQVGTHPCFKSHGHSFWITYANTLLTLANSTDPHFMSLPDPRHWIDAFHELRLRKSIRFDRGAPLHLSPIGAYEIFEGQARFIQIQYLYFATGRTLTWDDVDRHGMLSGVYVTAFQLFLD